jgi:heat shock protein HtpX
MGYVSNTLKTFVLIALLTALVMWVGYFIAGYDGLIIALILGLLMNGIMYWFSHKIVLAMYKAKELPPTHKVSKMVKEVATLAGLPTPKTYIVESATPNAFATGRNYKNAVVAVTTGILNLLTDDELKGVLAHEISHVKNRDMLVTTIAAVLAGIISYIAQFAALGGGDDNHQGNWVGLLLIIIVTPILAMLIQLAISRAREYGADESGARLLRNPHGLAKALGKLEHANQVRPFHANEGNPATSSLFIVNPFRGSWWKDVMSTHPAMEKRIARLQSLKL